MKRKVTLHGTATLSVSLPLEWAKRHGVKKGDELDVKEDNEALCIGLNSVQDTRKEITIQIPRMEARPLMFLIRNLYISGYDTIHLIFDHDMVFHDRLKIQMTMGQLISYELKRLMGFEIMFISRNSCTIKSLAKENGEEFYDSLRRIFLLFKEAFAELEHIVTEGHPCLSEYAQEVHDHITVLLAYNLRILTKVGYKNRPTTLKLYQYLSKLDDILDLLKYMLREIDGKTPFKNPKILEVTREFSSLYQKTYHLFYKFSLEEGEYIFTNRFKLLLEMTAEKGWTNDERRYIHYIEDILQEMYKLNIIRMGMEYLPVA